MKAIQLTGLSGFGSLRLADVAKPKPQPNEILIEVQATGVNFAELEMTMGRYPTFRPTPFTMGFEAAGVVVEKGAQVSNFSIGDRVTSLVSSGGYAEYAVADASTAIPIPDGITFAQATTIPVQGVSAYTLLHLAAHPQPDEAVLVQAAAGGVGLYLVQLAKLMGVKNVIGLASSQEKLDLVASLGADHAINHGKPDWPAQVREATGDKGVDVVLESASGAVGVESFKLLAPFGRIVVYGARNVHDTISPDGMQQLIKNNQSLIGFNLPSLPTDKIAAAVPGLLRLISERKVKIFAERSFPLAEVRSAFEALASRNTIGKVVLTVATSSSMGRSSTGG